MSRILGICISFIRMGSRQAYKCKTRGSYLCVTWVLWQEVGSIVNIRSCLSLQHEPCWRTTTCRAHQNASLMLCRSRSPVEFLGAMASDIHNQDIPCSYCNKLCWPVKLCQFYYFVLLCYYFVWLKGTFLFFAGHKQEALSDPGVLWTFSGPWL